MVVVREVTLAPHASAIIDAPFDTQSFQESVFKLLASRVAPSFAAHLQSDRLKKTARVRTDAIVL